MIEKTETIRVENLTTGYSGKHKVTAVTEGVTTSLYSGELTCLLGPNGAGKSTLLKTLSGFLPPLSGKIMIEGKDLQDYNDSELAKMIGVVLTERIAVTNMSVYELISMGRSPYTGFWGHLNQGDKEIVEEAIALVRIEDLRDRMVETLSDGERQKVMIAKALAQETPIIFLDEPTAFLDYPSKVEILRLLQNLSRIKRKTVFLSTHDLELALQIADKVWLIDKTHGVKTGTPEDLALAGYMSEYFEKEGVRFDLASGLFRIDNKLERKIRLEGDPVRNRLLQKAFARNGILADTDIECEDMIQSDENGYFFNGRKYGSIEALLKTIL
ncbi:MAG: ABC transporter ATP-binding protein [Bacteroidales bacterium]|nr:ABC transporter ATP-binding protein [Bacteroidales bacterium]